MILYSKAQAQKDDSCYFTAQEPFCCQQVAACFTAMIHIISTRRLASHASGFRSRWPHATLNAASKTALSPHLSSLSYTLLRFFCTYYYTQSRSKPYKKISLHRPLSTLHREMEFSKNKTKFVIFDIRCLNYSPLSKTPVFGT